MNNFGMYHNSQEKQHFIREGYVAINGHVFTAKEAALYNRQCNFTEQARAAYNQCPTSLECKRSLDKRLDLQNDLFKQITGMR